MNRFVLDTDVIVAAFRSARGASRQLLLMALEHRIDLLLSVPLMLEYESVLMRPEHLKASGATMEDVEAVLNQLAATCKKVEIVVRLRPMVEDPNDEMVLETAVNGQADAIVTFNERHFSRAASLAKFKLFRPGDLLRLLNEKEENQRSR